jgi:hypothetical protein
MAIKALITLKQNRLFTEWDTIMDILEELNFSLDKFQEKNLIKPFQDIF